MHFEASAQDFPYPRTHALRIACLYHLSPVSQRSSPAISGGLLAIVSTPVAVDHTAVDRAGPKQNRRVGSLNCGSTLETHTSGLLRRDMGLLNAFQLRDPGGGGRGWRMAWSAAKGCHGQLSREPAIRHCSARDCRCARNGTTVTRFGACCAGYWGNSSCLCEVTSCDVCLQPTDGPTSYRGTDRRRRTRCWQRGG